MLIPKCPHLYPCESVSTGEGERTIWKAPMIIFNFSGISASSVEAAATTLTACDRTSYVTDRSLRDVAWRKGYDVALHAP